MDIAVMYKVRQQPHILCTFEIFTIVKHRPYSAVWSLKWKKSHMYKYLKIYVSTNVLFDIYYNFIFYYSIYSVHKSITVEIFAKKFYNLFNASCLSVRTLEDYCGSMRLLILRRALRYFSHQFLVPLRKIDC